MAAEAPRCKLLLVMIDGLGDVCLSALGGRTPLQGGRFVHLDAVAKHGLCGLMDSVEPGLACGSDTAHLSIFGYSPRHFYRGRGAFESMGAGLHMEAGDIAFKSNFATLDPGTGVVVRRRADRDFAQWGVPLCEYLSGTRLPSFPNVTVSVLHATEHRCGVRLRGAGLSDEISGTDPLKDGLPLVLCAPLEGAAAREAAEFTSRVVNELSEEFRRRLEAHPLTRERRARGLPFANTVLLRGCGARVAVPSFSELHGLRGFAIAPTAIIAGLAETVGLEVLRVQGATGDYHTNLTNKAEAAIAALGDPTRGFEFGFLHIKAVDDAGHDRDLARKLEWLEKANDMVGLLIERLSAKARSDGSSFALAVTGDHSTPVLSGDHSCEPVPFAVAVLPFDPAHRKSELCDSVQSFDEVSAARGSLGRFLGAGVMQLLRRVAERAAVSGSNRGNV